MMIHQREMISERLSRRMNKSCACDTSDIRFNWNISSYVGCTHIPLTVPYLPWPPTFPQCVTPPLPIKQLLSTRTYQNLSPSTPKKTRERTSRFISSKSLWWICYSGWIETIWDECCSYSKWAGSECGEGGIDGWWGRGRDVPMIYDHSRIHTQNCNQLYHSYTHVVNYRKLSNKSINDNRPSLAKKAKRYNNRVGKQRAFSML